MPFDFELYHRAILTSYLEVNVVVLRLHSLLQQKANVLQSDEWPPPECGGFRLLPAHYVQVFTLGEPIPPVAKFQHNT